MPFIHDASKQRVDALEAPKESLKSSESAGKVAGPKASDDKSGKAGPDRGDKLQMLKGDAKASDRPWFWYGSS